jgi:Family of unknown function (DUF6502)
VDINAAARRALARLLGPLTGFVFDSGLSIKDVHAILRTAAVRSVAARQLEISRRVNISGISASTGITRAEVSRILKSGPISSEKNSDRHQQSTNRILSAWQQDPRFATPNGQPADLKMYGRGSTFDALVKLHGKGIPTRAMLDELIRARAIEVRSAQLIRLKTPVAVDRGISSQAVKAFGDRVTELMATLLQNMRDPENSAFVASAAHARVSANELPLLRREISSRGAEFLTEIQEIMARGPFKSRSSTKAKEAPFVSVTIFYHEKPGRTKTNKSALTRRRNFRRNP